MGGIRLSSLRLVGFKSFPDSLELSFPGMVTAIVGPNGSGKSNLVDAILWVLGEQSPSLLRLKSMGDLVFSGSVRRPAAGAAEVSLRLTASDGLWDQTDGQLDVTRRVYRTGPSDYRLNGRSARLRDVQDQLLAVGLGTRAYAIIEQGRVGQVLSARPVDRRVLLEEAAGISRYKARRHDAELKLEATKQNLLRLEDVVAEVERSLRQLKRQARAAERYQQLSDDLNERLHELYREQGRALRKQREKVARTVAQAENEAAATAAALASSSSELAQQREQVEQVRSDRDAAREEVAALQSSCERRETFLSRSADLLDSLRSALERLRTEASGTADSLIALGESVSSAVQRRDELTDELATARERLTAASTRHAECVAEGQTAEQQAAERRQQMLRCISSLTESRNRLGDLERELDRLAYSMTTLQHERDRVATRHTDASSQFDEVRQRAAVAAAHHQELDNRRHDLEGARDDLASQLADADHQLERLGDERWNQRHALDGLERQLAQTQAAVGEVSAVLADDDVFGQVSDYLHPDAELAEVLDRVWRELLDLPVISVAASRTDLVESFRRSDGRMRMAVRDANAEPVTTAATEALPEWLQSLLAEAGVAEDERPWIERVLPPAYRCQDPARDLHGVACAHPHARFLDAAGVLHCGATVELPAGGGGDRGVLALRAQRDAALAAIATSDQRIAAAKAERVSVEQDRQQLIQKLNELGPQLVQAQQEQTRAATMEQSLSAEVRRLRRELEGVDQEIERTGRQHQEASDRQRRLTEEVTKLEARGQDLEASMSAANDALEQHRATIAAAARELDQRRGHERLAAERAQTACGEVQRLEAEQGSTARREQSLQREIEATAARLEATESEVVTTRTGLAEEQGLLASARERERQLRERTEEAAATLTTLESEVAERRAANEAAREQLHEHQVERTRLDGSWDALAAQVVNELGVSLESLLKSADELEMTREELEEAITALRKRLERIGPVNLLALREVEELGERAEFLHTQRKDLVDSVKSLEGTIAEIDETCTERFVATFDQVNEVFLETFSYLFGGGSAKLILVDEENPLESGIDIIAQPPGKKNQSVQLLSGGEKALAALSLLISLFRIKPSPFCILDEVDAPLDDANVERLGDIVRSMTEHTQFVMITHNRRTMARADVLYGVTMEEPGVSKVVSVRMEE